jgi:hypothetical protein
MNKNEKFVWAERLLFTMLLVTMGMAGAAYETYKRDINNIILVPLIIIFLFSSYGLYLLFLGVARRKLLR